MKVTDKEREASAEMAAWLGFLRKAKRVTLQSIAETHGTHRGNLSAFISSKGTTRNVSMDKLRMVLFDLGLLDGGMLAPGLHRWEVDDEMVDSLCELLNKSAFERGYVFRLGNGLRAFAVVQVCEAKCGFREPACRQRGKSGRGAEADAGWATHQLGRSRPSW